jgi:hypothetical protein
MVLMAATFLLWPLHGFLGCCTASLAATLTLWTQCGANGRYTDKKEKKIFIMYKEIQSGAVAKSYMRRGSLIYEEMRKYFPIYEEAVSHI